jgi:uncharacterized protein
MRRTFYASGLRFECTRCSKCCRHTPGYVFLSAADLELLAGASGLAEKEFLDRYCRSVDLGLARRISLREKANFDCILWENGGCSRYEARPLQCRSFPFWSACIASQEDWLHHARNCPGMGKGTVHSREEIEGWLNRRVDEGFIEA